MTSRAYFRPCVSVKDQGVVSQFATKICYTLVVPITDSAITKGVFTHFPVELFSFHESTIFVKTLILR